MDTFDLTPSPKLLDLLGRIPFKGWQCVAELVDNSVDAIINKGADLRVENKTIEVSIPTRAKLLSNEPMVVEDWGVGMSDQQLEKAVRAGFSNKSTGESLGLFGMGFNVATARLANTVEVWTSTADAKTEIGVRIDLREMKKHGSFIRPRLARPKNPSKVSGTRIEIYDFKPDAQNLLKPQEIVREIGRTYSSQIFESHGIKILVNGTQIKPFRFCVWSAERAVRYKDDEVPAIIEIDQKLAEELFCENCFTWVEFPAETSLQMECPNCQSTGSIVRKTVQLSGWVGIQRYTDTEHFGIDISRNGRVLSRLDRSFFSWNKNNSNDWRLNPEYPRDTPHAGGRIVGQIEANFVVPKYTKDDFEREDKHWLKAVDYLRGEGPFQPDLAEQRNYTRNRSPLGRLFSAYRKPSPPGAKTLIFGKVDGSADYITPRNWAQKFYQGETEYLSDTLWWKRVSEADLHTEVQGKKEEPTASGHDQEKFPGKKLQRYARQFDLEKLLNEKPIDITVIDYFPDIDVTKPIIFDPKGPNRYFVYLNNHHPLFKDFADGYEDLIFMEVAAKFAALKASEDWTLSRIYYELKSRYAAETMLSVPNLVNRATDLIRKVQNALIDDDGVMLGRPPDLTDSDRKILQQKYLDLENSNVNLGLLLMTSKYLKYLDLTYVFKFIKDFPELVFDNKLFNLPYGELDPELQTIQLGKYLGYFDDVRWFMNELSRQGDAGIKKMKQQILQKRHSMENLYGCFSK
jgi:hypothetical protein